jgi:phosphoserine phosphatase
MNINSAKEAINHADVICLDIDRILFTDKYINSIISLLKNKDVNSELLLLYMRETEISRDALKAKIDLIKPNNVKEIEIIQSQYSLQYIPLISILKELIMKLHKKGTNIYLLSDGFQQLITPIASYLGVSIYNTYATNNLNFDVSGEYNGSTSIYSGKAEIIQHLVDVYNYKYVVMIGDEFSSNIQINPHIKAFVVYGRREIVGNKSVWFITDFQEIVDIIVVDSKYKSENKSIYYYDVEPWDDDWPWGPLTNDNI